MLAVLFDGSDVMRLDEKIYVIDIVFISLESREFRG